MATRATIRSCQFLSTRLVPGPSKSAARVPSAACLILCREFKPFSKIPKKFQRNSKKKKVERNNEIYFLSAQLPLKHYLDDALDCVRAYSLFGEQPIDLILHLDVGEEKKKIESVRGLVHFPKPLTQQTVLVFAEGDAAEQARCAGAAIVGGVELIEQVENNRVRFDHCIATVDFLPKIRHLAKILRERMPNTKRGSASNDIVPVLERFGTSEKYATDGTGSFRHTVARTSFTKEEIRNNVLELIKAVDSHKTRAQSEFYKRVTISTPLGLKYDLFVEDVVP